MNTSSDTVLHLIAPVCAALNLDPLAGGLQLVAAHDLRASSPVVAPSAESAVRSWAETQHAGAYTPALVPFPLVDTRPALICRLDDAALAADAMHTLLSRYPAQHAVTLVQVVDGAAHVWSAPLDALSQQDVDAQTCAYLAPLAPLDDLRGDGVAFVVARLLGPGGCPWDVRQTHRSLRDAILEEAHEVLEAIDNGDMDALAEELGDLLLSVLAHSEMARQAGAFDLGDVRAGIAAKLIRRHPHVFGTTVVNDAGDVVQNWDAIKQVERAAKGKPLRTSALDGIPPLLPALPTGQTLIRKATKAGFDYDDVRGVWAKLREEISELEAALDTEPHADDAARSRRVEEEFGDLLLALAKLAHWLHIDAESALREANAKFRRRFARMEQLLSENGRSFATMTMAEKDVVWQQAKRYER